MGGNGAEPVTQCCVLNAAGVKWHKTAQRASRHQRGRLARTVVAQQPDGQAAAVIALSTRRSRTIAAIIPTLAHSIFATFLDGVERELALHGYALVVTTTGGSLAREALRAREMLQLGAEGLIVSGSMREAGFEAWALARRIPVVATSIYHAKGALPTIGYDNRALGRQAMDHLRGLGHRRIAVLHGPVADNDRTRLRLEGVHSAALDRALRLHETTLDATGGAAAARAALAARPRCTAMLCLSDVLALGALFEARRLGLAVPAQVSVMGFDDLEWAAVADPPLTTLRLPTLQMGELAARALVDYLDSATPIKSRLLPAEVVLRASTGAAPKR